MEIRLENEKDYLEVEKIVRNSFWNVYRPGAYEHFIVHNLRNDKSFISNLAYVIEDEGKIIGHISYSNGEIRYENAISNAVMLGPVAIDENYRNRGLGSKLIDFTLKLAQKDNIPFIFVVGDEKYYSRFGFVCASEYGFYLNGTSTDNKNPFFMIKIFDDVKIGNDLGIFHTPEVFDVDECEVDEFDRQFEFKEKLIKEGQLGV